jgi:hypothetical protein
MFEVTKYDPPHIFVTSRQTGETYIFVIGDDGAVAHEGERYDHGDPHRAAIAYLAQGKRSTTRDFEASAFR